MSRITRIAQFLASVAVFLLTTAAVSAYIMTFISDPNEHMYVAASILIQDKHIYKDFSYVQMPYLPIFYSFLYEATGTDHLLFAARAATCAFWALAAFTMLATARVISGSRAISWCAFLLFALNTFVLRASRECSNYVSPMACFNVALLFFVMGVQHRHRRPAFLATSGLFAALAVGLKLYYAAVVPPLFVLALLFPREEGTRRRILSGVLPLSGGFLVGIAPALFVMARDPQAFLFNNLLFHGATTRAYVEHAMTKGIPPGMTIFDRVVNLKYAFQEMCFILIGIAFAGTVGWGNVGRKGLAWLAPLILGVSSVSLAGLVVVYMTPLWQQYFAFPVPFAILLFAALHGRLRGSSRRANVKLAWILAAAGFLVIGPRVFRELPRLLRPAQFVPMKFHQVALALRTLVGGGADAGPVATLMPIYPLEAGLPIYDELSTGVFLYWIGDRLTEAERLRYVGTGPGSIERLLEERPPSAILVRTFDKDDAPLIRYAQRYEYRRLDNRDDPDLAELVLYVQRN